MGEERRGMPSLQWGMTFGIILVVISIIIPVIWLVANGYHIPPDAGQTQSIINQSGVGIVFFAITSALLSLASYFLAGFLTARDSGSIRAGGFSAALAFLASIMVWDLVSAVVLRISASALLAEIAGLPMNVRAALALLTAAGNIGCLLTGALVAAGIGALGALLGCAIYGRASYP